MIPKPIEKIGVSDLRALVGEVRENKTIEFKSQMIEPGKLLAAVSALANTGGGDFVVGVGATADGVAASIDGIEITNVDEEKLRIEQLLANCLEPRLPRVDVHPIQLEDSKYVIVIRTLRSWVGPHRNTKDNKFYGRNSAGNYPLDVGELRTAFVLGEQTAERIRAFRTDRLFKIMGGETPVPLSGAGAIVLHMIPLPAFGERALHDVVGALERGTHFPLPLQGMSGGNSPVINLDGVANYVSDAHGAASSYVQLFRSGAIEGVIAIRPFTDGKPYFAAGPVANMIVQGARQYLNVLANLEFAFPVLGFLSLCGIEGCRMRYTVANGLSWEMTEPLHGNVIALPEVTFERPDSDIPTTLRPVFNMIWNTFGFLRCDLYDANGVWTIKSH